MSTGNTEIWSGLAKASQAGMIVLPNGAPQHGMIVLPGGAPEAGMIILPSG